MTDIRKASAADGTAIAFRIWGDPAAGRRVALVHALAMSGAFWEDVATQLGPDVAVLAVDCRGHGVSDKPKGPYTVEIFARDLAAVLDNVGWGNAVIGGASMGGCVAQAFAEHFPERTQALALIDTTAWYGEGASEAWEGRAQKALQNGMSALTDFQKTRWFSDSYLAEYPDQVEKHIGIFLKNDAAAYAETCRMLGRCDQRIALQKLTMPVEILVGEEDYATPIAMAEAMGAQIPQAVLTVLPGVRHFTPLEWPEAIAAALQRLLDRFYS